MSSAATTPAPAPQPGHETSPHLLQQVMASWHLVLKQLSNQGEMALVAALTACRLADGGEDGLLIHVPDLRDCACLFHRSADIEQQLRQLLTVHLHQDLAVRIRGAPGTSARGRYRQAEDHPLVQQLRKRFDAEILAFEPMSEADWERHLQQLDGTEETPE